MQNLKNKSHNELIEVILKLRNELTSTNRKLEKFLSKVDPSNIDGLITDTDEEYKRIFEYAPIGIMTINCDGVAVKMNQHMLDILGSPSAEATRKISILKVPALVDNGFVGDFNTCISTKKVQKNRTRYKSKWGVLKFVKYILTPITNKGGDVVGVQTIYEDITDQHETLEALADSERTFRSIFDNAVDSIYVQDADGTFLDVNQGVVNMYGYSKEELIGKTPAVVSAPDLNDLDAVTKSLALAYNGEPQQFEFWGMRKNGEVFPKIVRVSSGYYFGKKAIFALAVDITHLKDLEQKLQSQNEEYASLNEEYKTTNEHLELSIKKAQENEMLKTSFLNNISHEIHMPMNGIIGFTSLLKNSDLSIEERKTYVDNIMVSGQRMLKTIHDLMAVSKIETGQLELIISKTNVNEILQNLYHSFKEITDKKRLSIKLTEGLPNHQARVLTDENKLRDILYNLLANAVKFTDFGSIEFGYSIINIGENPYLKFFVNDTGVGIPANRIDSIFNRFVKANIADARVVEGAGMGLSISKAFVDIVGGKIWVDSIVGEGSKFYFTIPYNKQEEDTSFSAETKSSKLSVGGLKVLVVEDEHIADEFLTIVLRDISKEILHVRTGSDAIEICKANPDFDLILMDIKLPVLNGLEATKQIRKFNKDVPIIAQTAYTLAGDRQKSLKAGCNDYIAKPIDKEVLLNKIEKLV